jgi:hypothetical protein
MSLPWVLAKRHPESAIALRGQRRDTTLRKKDAAMIAVLRQIILVVRRLV